MDTRTMRISKVVADEIDRISNRLNVPSARASELLFLIKSTETGHKPLWNMSLNDAKVEISRRRVTDKMLNRCGAL